MNCPNYIPPSNVPNVVPRTKFIGYIIAIVSILMWCSQLFCQCLEGDHFVTVKSPEILNSGRNTRNADLFNQMEDIMKTRQNILSNLKNLPIQSSVGKDGIFDSGKQLGYGSCYYNASKYLTIVTILFSFYSFPSNWNDKTGWTTKGKDDFKKATIRACLSLIGASFMMLLSCIYLTAAEGYSLGGAVIFWWVISPLSLIVSGACWCFALKI